MTRGGMPELPPKAYLSPILWLCGAPGNKLWGQANAEGLSFWWYLLGRQWLPIEGWYNLWEKSSLYTGAPTGMKFAEQKFVQENCAMHKRANGGVTRIILVGSKISFVTTRSNIEKGGLAHKKSGALALGKLSTGSTKRDQS